MSRLSPAEGEGAQGQIGGDRIHDDFIVSVHALERFQQRFPKDWTNDEDVGLLIYHECQAGLDEGRSSYVPPLELANYDLDRWEPGKGLIVWTPSKARGYVLQEDTQGVVVSTVLKGMSTAEARRMLYGGKRKES